MCTAELNAGEKNLVMDKLPISGGGGGGGVEIVLVMSSRDRPLPLD